MCIVTKVIQSHIFEDKTTRSSQPETPKDRIRLLYRNVIHGHTRRLRQHAMGVFFCDGMLQKYWPFRKQKLAVSKTKGCDWVISKHYTHNLNLFNNYFKSIFEE